MSDTALCPNCNKYFDSTFVVENCPKCGVSLKDVVVINHVYRTDERNIIDLLIPGIAAFSVLFLMSLIMVVGKVTHPVAMILTAVAAWATYKIISDKRLASKK